MRGLSQSSGCLPGQVCRSIRRMRLKCASTKARSICCPAPVISKCRKAVRMPDEANMPHKTSARPTPTFIGSPSGLPVSGMIPSQAGAIKSQSVFWHSVHPALSPKLNNTGYLVPVFSGAYNQVQTSSTPAGLKKLHQHISFNGKFSESFLPPDLEKSSVLGRLLRFAQMK